MKRTTVTVSVVGALALLTGCSAEPTEPDATTVPQETPSEEATADIEDPSGQDEAGGASATIEDTWAKIGCVEGDFTGTRGILDVSEARAPVESTGTCTPYEDGDMAFFFQLPSAADVPAWLSSGALEVGATDAVFVDGAVVILATDAHTAQEFSSIFEPAP